MSTPLLSVTEAMLMTALREALLVLWPSAAVVQGYQNRVAMPTGATLEMTSLTDVGLSTTDAPPSGWVPGASNPGLLTLRRSEEWVCQLDFYGPGASDAARLVNLLVRSDYAFATFVAQTPEVLAPLYATPSKQLPFINDSNQYEPRWMFEFHAQYNPVVEIPQDFATSLEVTPVNVDARFPPSET